MNYESNFWITRFLFQKGLALVYLIAFLVALNQFIPLLGEKGLLPVPLFIKRLKFFDSPSLFFFFAKDIYFQAFALAGVALSLVALTGISEKFGNIFSAVVWGLLWLLYLSFVNVGQTFYAFGWESLLLETGFLAIFLGSANSPPSTITIWLLRWVLFRIIFGAGLIKLRGDSCWKDLTCLFYHYETQPMPNPLSWYFHWMPQWFHRAGVAFNHFVELVVPFGYFGPRFIASMAGIFTVFLMAILMLSGNLSFLNFITIVLAISAFDDSFFLSLFPYLKNFIPQETLSSSLLHQGTIAVLLVMVAILSIPPILNMLSSRQIMNTSFNKFHFVNTYGAFGSITKKRYEIVIEGTKDLSIVPTTQWKEYEFKGKPTDLKKRPPQIAPYHLRLDWLMWFAAMDSYYYHPWFVNFMAKIFQNDKKMLQLIKNNPFPDHPPFYIRASLYLYRFTTPQERKETGNFWHREYVGIYFPAISFDNPSFIKVLQDQKWL